jgi:sugar phosphate isomerase/epimerase
MNMTNRRSFIKSLSAGGALVTLSSAAFLSQTGCKPTAGKNDESKEIATPSPELKISLQEGVSPGETLIEKLDFMEANGIKGIEFWGGGLEKRITELTNALQNRKIQIGAICAGFSGWLIAADEKNRKECMDTSKVILQAAGELGSYGMILVPGFNSQVPSLPTVEARAILIEYLKELGEFAAQHKTAVILEPLNRKEAWFLRQVADAAAICRDVNSTGVTCMGDFWHMTWEETSDMGAFLSGDKYLNHVHIASRKTRNTPGEDEGDNYVDGFKGLKMLNYQHHVSFECGTKGDKKIVIPAAIKMLNEQWAMA